MLIDIYVSFALFLTHSRYPICLMRWTLKIRNPFNLHWMPMGKQNFSKVTSSRWQSVHVSTSTIPLHRQEHLALQIIWMERHKSFRKHRLLAKCSINYCNSNKIDEKLRWSIELRKYMNFCHIHTYTYTHTKTHKHTILFPLFLTLCKLRWEHFCINRKYFVKYST